MGQVIKVVFPTTKKKPRPSKKRIALTHGALPDGRVFLAAKGKWYFTTAEFTSLLAELRETRDDAIAKRRAKRG